jgi:signal transduction histidine kinase
VLAARSESWREGIFKVGWLSTSVVHDLRNPLGTIYAGAEMLMDPDTTPAQVKRLAANIRSAAGRMRELLTDVVSVARGSESVVEICDIRAVIRAALAVADMPGIQIVFDAPDAIKAALVRFQMERVFVNLIINSMEAMPAGGTVRIVARSSDNFLLVEFEDDGPGIPSEICDRLFEPFVTARKENGLGLGLAFCRQTILEHGGEIWSQPVAKGARFIIRLPLEGGGSIGLADGNKNGYAPTRSRGKSLSRLDCQAEQHD